MKKQIRTTTKHLFIISVTLLSLLPSIPAFAQEPGVSVVYRLEKENLSQGEPVLVEVELKNSSSQEHDVDLGGDRYDNISISVMGPDGQRYSRTPIDPRNRIVFSGVIHLEPNETFAESLVLNQWFDFDAIGSYTIEMALRSAFASRRSLYLNVQPRDEASLKIRCSELLTRIQRTTSAQELIASTQALSFVRDPAAIPAWESLINRPDLSDTAISALVKIGGPESLQALIANLANPDKGIRASVRSALKAIVDHTSDDSLRNKIQAALESSDGTTRR